MTADTKYAKHARHPAFDLLARYKAILGAAWTHPRALIVDEATSLFEYEYEGKAIIEHNMRHMVVAVAIAVAVAVAQAGTS